MSINDKSNKQKQTEAEFYRRTDFPSADAKYQALVQYDQNDIKLQDHLSHHTRPWELSFIEAEIFEIDPELAPALDWAYERYESFVGSMDAYFEQFREQERIDYAKHYRGKMVYEMQAAINFMADACQLPSLQCFGWIMKVYTAALRGGVLSFYQMKSAIND